MIRQKIRVVLGDMPLPLLAELNLTVQVRAREKGHFGFLTGPDAAPRNAAGAYCRGYDHNMNQKELHYSMTSSARARIDGGTVSPSAFTVLRLTTSSKVVGCRTGRSAGFSPLRIRPA